MFFVVVFRFFLDKALFLKWNKKEEKKKQIWLGKQIKERKCIVKNITHRNFDIGLILIELISYIPENNNNQ